MNHLSFLAPTETSRATIMQALYLAKWLPSYDTSCRLVRLKRTISGGLRAARLNRYIIITFQRRISEGTLFV